MLQPLQEAVAKSGYLSSGFLIWITNVICNQPPTSYFSTEICGRSTHALLISLPSNKIGPIVDKLLRKGSVLSKMYWIGDPPSHWQSKEIVS